MTVTELFKQKPAQISFCIFFVLFCACCILAFAYSARQSRARAVEPESKADYVEITAELTSTFESSSKTDQFNCSAICIVGTNDWYLSGDFALNAHHEYWLVNTNIIERQVITSGMYLQQAENFVSQKVLHRDPVMPSGFSYPKPGVSFTNVWSWERPIGDGVERVFWLAFCSGSYLQMKGRQIPLPIGLYSDVGGFSDKTMLLDGARGLPKEIKFYAPDGKVVCEYEVLSTTNIFGRQFPLNFRLIQYRNPRSQSDTSSGPKYIVVGKINSIKSGKKPEAPKLPKADSN